MTMLVRMRAMSQKKVFMQEVKMKEWPVILGMKKRFHFLYLMKK